jgi:ammonium transporter, Amt family
MNPTTLEGLAHHAVDAHGAVNVMWALVTGFFAVLMQGGFAFLDTGLVRSKNVSHSMAMGVLAYCVSIVGYWAVGFALQGGAVGNGLFTSADEQSLALLGGRGFFLSPTSVTSSLAAAFILRAASASVVATIPTGAGAERWKLSSLVAFSLVVSALIYPMFAHWVWGGGWLALLGRNRGIGHGVVDAGGGAVIHMTGGVVALVAAKVLGPRVGKYSLRGDVRPIPAHNMPMVVFGTFILAAGWFGLVTGSAWSGMDNRVALVALNTMLAGAAGGAWAFFHTRMRFGKPDLSMMCNGLLSGLVAISAGGAFVASTSAVLIGAMASLLTVEGALLIERKLRIDDPAGAAAVHGVGGAWGLLAVGIFANGRSGDGWNGVVGPVRGLVDGSSGQLLASVIGIVANIVWVAPIAALALLVIGRLIGNRATVDDEIGGLDVPELGMTGYVSEAVHSTGTRSSDLGHGRMSGGQGASARH